MISEENELFKERYVLSSTRVRELKNIDYEICEKFRDYFCVVGRYLDLIFETNRIVAEKKFEVLSPAEKRRINIKLYEPLLPEHYKNSYANPTYANEMLGIGYGQYLSMLYAQILALPTACFENDKELILIFSELFIQTACYFESDEIPSLKEIKQIISSFFYDYSSIFFGRRTVAFINTEDNFAYEKIFKIADGDISSLYDYGEYISKNETELAHYLSSLKKSQIDKIASIFVNGFLISFKKAGKDLSSKRIASLVFHAGSELIAASIIRQMEKAGFNITIPRHPVFCTDMGNGYEGAHVNRQFESDHSNDMALFFGKKYASKAFDCIKKSLEQNTLASYYGGPMVLEVFGEETFFPQLCRQAVDYSKTGMEILLGFHTKRKEIINKAIDAKNRSFVIMDIPLPELGDNFDELFQEVCKINELDSDEYEEIQQFIIDALNSCDFVKIKGKYPNKTDIIVNLFKLTDDKKETIFENCVADVNIPLGEVFTTPVLKGTKGKLFISKVYLNNLLYKNLEIDFIDGRVSNYICTNYDDEDANRKYILNNAFNHNTELPMGEFAIGTNTTAYAMSRKYKIEEKLPILIAEKTGPHFAVGDSCYSYEEDTTIIASDGKEIVAKDNEVSILRKTEPQKAYFNCHVDITIPYDELDSIIGVRKDNSEISIIKNGRFVLPGTIKLNKPIEKTL